MSTATASIRTQLIRTERGWALPLDAEMLKDTGMADGAVVLVKKEGNQLVVSPAPPQDPRKKFEDAKRDTFEKYDDVFRKLAE